jgi:hypothetical protein
MNPDEQEQEFIIAVEDHLEQHPNPPEGASAWQAEQWFSDIVNAIRPKLVPRAMPLAIFLGWQRTLRRTYQFQVPWGEARQKTDIMLRQERP